MDVEYLIDEFYEVYDIENSSIFYSTPKDDYYKCRYCGTEDKSKFKNRAHLLPQFTGNEDLFAYDECDDCNNLFGKYETSLNAFGGIKNVFVPIKGKKKYPKYKDNTSDFTLQYQNGKQLLNRVTGDNNITKVEDGFLKVNAATQSFIPLHVYKAIAKFAISMLKKDDLLKFNDTIRWLINPNEKIDISHPLYLIVNDDVRPPLKSPLCVLFKKKKEFNCPEYCFILCYGFHRYQIFLQYNTGDNSLDYKHLKLILNYDFVLKRGDDKIHFKHYDMNSLTKSSINHNFSLKFNQNGKLPL